MKVTRRFSIARDAVWSAALAAALSCVLPCAQAKVIEEQLDVPVQVTDAYGKKIEQPIKVTVFVDDALPSPKPVIVINHGRAVEATARAALGRVRMPDTARWFARNGFIVALPTRIGYGVSGGEDVEDTGACNRKNYPPGYAAAAQQVVTVLDAVRARPDAQRDRSVILGQSYGGATAVAVAALNPPGVVTSINFAGGGGGDPKGHPGKPCAPQLLEKMFAGYGQSARIPMLWVYTENDLYFGPDYPRAWFEAYKAAGGTAEFVQFPPHGDDGHLLFARFQSDWQPVVATFLRGHGYAMDKE